MIAVPGPLDALAGRLFGGLVARGVAPAVSVAALRPAHERITLVLAPSPGELDVAAHARALGLRLRRVLVLSRLGAHPDAREPGLRRLWRLEESARACGAPVLTLRFAPLVGPATPFWNRLRTRPELPQGGRKLLNPALERDAVETLARALDGRAAWEGWFEVAGPEVWSLAELRELAVAAGPGPDAGAWEPSLAELAEHRLAESAPWCEHFALVPGAIAEGVKEAA